MLTKYGSPTTGGAFLFSNSKPHQFLAGIVIQIYIALCIGYNYHSILP